GEELIITYRGRDLRADKSQLSVVGVRVVNRGSSPIRVGDFDSRAPLSLEFGAHIVEYSSEFSNGNWMIDNSGALVLPPFVLNSSESFTVRVLALHKAGQDLSVRVNGRVAGRDLKVEETPGDPARHSTSTLLFSSYGMLVLGFLLGMAFAVRKHLAWVGESLKANEEAILKMHTDFALLQELTAKKFGISLEPPSSNPPSKPSSPGA
ncbi:MAG: hypothetical protein AAGF23_14495, partial [Acidobacteriota bacterium]